MTRADRQRGSGKQRRQRRARLVRQQQGLCHWCGGYMREDVDQNHPLRATLDWITPRRLGGSGTPANLVAACRACNRQRISEGAA